MQTEIAKKRTDGIPEKAQGGQKRNPRSKDRKCKSEPGSRNCKQKEVMEIQTALKDEKLKN